MQVAPVLVTEMKYLLEVDGPISTERRQLWQMVSATLVGPRIRAASAMPGMDWFTPVGDGFGHPHVRIGFRTDDGALVLLEYRGIVHATKAFQRAVETDTSTAREPRRRRVLFTPPELAELNAAATSIPIQGARLPDSVLVLSELEAPPKK